MPGDVFEKTGPQQQAELSRVHFRYEDLVETIQHRPKVARQRVQIAQVRGRNRSPFLLQVYRRDMGGGNFVMMKDLSAPIRVAGRHTARNASAGKGRKRRMLANPTRSPLERRRCRTREVVVATVPEATSTVSASSVPSLSSAPPGSRVCRRGRQRAAPYPR